MNSVGRWDRSEPDDFDSWTRRRDPRQTQFVGFAETDPCLFEFDVPDGRHVSLGEGFFESFRYEAGAPPTVVFTFVFGDKGVQDRESQARVLSLARVNLRFEDAFVIAWDSSQEMPHYRNDLNVPHGQVEDFRAYSGRCFALETIDDTIYVEATTVEVTIETLSAESAARALARVAGTMGQ